MVSRALFAVLIVLSGGVLFGFMIGQLEAVSLRWLMTWTLLALSMFFIERWVLYRTLSLLRERGINSKRVIMVGYGDTGRELHQRANAQRWTGYQIVATYDANGSIAIDTRIEALRRLEDIPSAVERYRADEVWITLPLAETAQLYRVQTLLGNALVDIRWVPDVAAISILTHRTVEFLGMPVVELNHPASNGGAGLIKVIFDRLFATLVLVLLSPLFIAIAIAIRAESPGPILFRQPRLGLNGQRFDVLKFRSMKLHQDRE
jgi:putative colanic acid biosynthesis UDP-glucose lipid carrier transferase